MADDDWITPQAAPTSAGHDDWVTPSAAPAQAQASAPPKGGFWRNVGAGLEEFPGDVANLLGSGNPGGFPFHDKPTDRNPAADLTSAIGKTTGLDPSKVSENTFTDKLGRNLGRAAPTLIAPGGTVADAVRVAAGGLGSVVGSTVGQQVAPNSPLVQTATGLLGGLGAGSAAAGRFLPRPTDDASSLINEGVPLTPGQMYGHTAKTIEDRISSIPLIGDIIKAAQRNSVAGFNKVVLDRVLSPIGQALPKGIAMGRDAISHVYNAIDGAYDKVLPNLSASPDAQLTTDLSDAASKLRGEGAKPETLSRLDNIVQAQIHDRVQNGSFTGQALKDSQSNLGRLANDYVTSADADDRALGRGLFDVQNSFNALIERQNPHVQGELQNVNNAFAQYARVRKAGSSLGNKDGIFTPAQFANAVKAGDKSAGKGAYARGDAFMQDISDPANRVLPQTVPDSGTAGRYLTAAALGLGAGEISPGATALAAKLAAGAAPTAAIYSKPGIRAMNAIANRPSAPFPTQGLVPAAMPGLQQQSPYKRGGMI